MTPTGTGTGTGTTNSAAEFGIELGTVPAVADPLTATLRHLHMDGMFYCPSELSAPWGVELPPMPGCLWFHVITSGNCTLIDAAGEAHHLTSGDVVVLPHGLGHLAYDEASAPTPVVFDLPHEYFSRQYALLRHGGGGERTNLICGLVRMGSPGARSLLALLPDVIRIGAGSGDQRRWLPGLVALMGDETRHPRPGSEAVVTRLCDILVIQTVRSWIEGAPPASQGWVGALRDPVVGPAIALIHNHPERPWTVAALAQSVGLSRSAFSARFTELVGQSVKAYLTEWRMQLARDILGSESSGINEIAVRLGYGSEAAFSRAYKRVMGEAPSNARPSAVAVTTDQGALA